MDWQQSVVVFYPKLEADTARSIEVCANKPQQASVRSVFLRTFFVVVQGSLLLFILKAFVVEYPLVSSLGRSMTSLDMMFSV
jgi:hypothetical protein